LKTQHHPPGCLRSTAFSLLTTPIFPPSAKSQRCVSSRILDPSLPRPYLTFRYPAHLCRSDRSITDFPKGLVYLLLFACDIKHHTQWLPRPLLSSSSSSVTVVPARSVHIPCSSLRDMDGIIKHHRRSSILLRCGVVLAGYPSACLDCCANIMMPSPDHLRQAPLDW
jgi:hypothetical protein